MEVFYWSSGVLTYLVGLQVQNASDRVQVNDIQSLLCATLQSVLRKVTKEDAPKISDNIMTALLQMFQSSAQVRRHTLCLF